MMSQLGRHDNHGGGICNNCGKSGHMIKSCKLPINSFGIIAFTIKENVPRFIMIRRKDSFGYIDFIRGIYLPYNLPQLQRIINEMSVVEKDRLMMYEAVLKNAQEGDTGVLTRFFHCLWKMMWDGENKWAITEFNLLVHVAAATTTASASSSTTFTKKFDNPHARQEQLKPKTEEEDAANKFRTLCSGIQIGDQFVTLRSLIMASTTDWAEPEWEFPKGRRTTSKEREVDCAIREFEEETGISSTHLHLIENVIPYEEIFIGTNQKAYKYKYFLTYVEPNHVTFADYQLNEVSKIDCKTIDECLHCIRPYNLEKKQMIQNISDTLCQYGMFITND